MKENRVQATDGGNAGQVYMMAVFDTMELLRLESGSNKDYRTFIDEELRRVIPGEPAPQRAFIQAEVPDIEGFGRMAPRSRDLRQALSAVRNADGIIRRIVTLNEIIGCCQCGLDPLDPHDLELFYRHMERERVRTGHTSRARPPDPARQGPVRGFCKPEKHSPEKSRTPEKRPRHLEFV